MFSETLKNEQPFATKLFSAAIKTNKLSQAYLFTQAQAIVQYNFSMELAKVLNCTNKVNDKPCDNCIDCKWIKNNTHPAVITISPVDFVPQKEDYGKNESTSATKTRSKNIINVEQSRLLQKTLATSSKYHRVVIFMGAKDENLPAEIIEHLWLDYKERVNAPESSKGRNSWVAMYLNYNSFPPETANILLKTIEEPLGRVLFIFIAKDADDLISTIVSRCQTVPLLSQKEIQVEPVEYLQEIATYLPPRNELDSIKIAKSLIDFAKKEDIEIEHLLEYIEILYHKQLMINISRSKVFCKLIGNINKIEQAKNMIKNYVNPQAVLISLLNDLKLS